MLGPRGFVSLLAIGWLGACGGRTIGDDSGARAAGGGGVVEVVTDETGPVGGFASEFVDPIPLDSTDPFARDPRDGIVIAAPNGSQVVALRIAVDAAGQVYLAGAAGDAATLGRELPRGKDSVVFVARLTADGELVWREPLPDCGEVAEMVIGPGGDPWVVCPYLPNESRVRHTDTSQAAAIHLDARDASVVRESVIERSDSRFGPRGLAVDARGVAYVGGGVRSEAVASPEQSVVYRIEPDGDPTQFWVPRGTTSGADSSISDVAVFAGGKTIVTGAFAGGMEVDGERIDSPPFDGSGSGSWAISGFVGRPESNIAPMLQLIGGSTFDIGCAVEPRPGGGVVLVGALGASGVVGGLTAVSNVGGSPFVALLDDAGNGERLRVTPGMGAAYDVAVGTDGWVHFVGSFAYDELVFSYDSATDTLVSQDLVEGESVANGVAVGADDSLWIVGSFSGAIDLGRGPLSTDGQSAYLLRLDAPQ